MLALFGYSSHWQIVVLLIGSTVIKFLAAIANVCGLVISPCLFAFSSNQAGLSSLQYLSVTCLINCVYPLAPAPLISVVNPVVFEALFCCFGVFRSGNLRGKTACYRCSGL